jgi:hypothetical protein
MSPSRYRLEREPSYTYSQTIELESGNGHGILRRIIGHGWGIHGVILERDVAQATTRPVGPLFAFPSIVRGWRAFRLFHDQWSPHFHLLSSITARIPHLILLSSNVTKLRFLFTTRNVTISSPHGSIAFLINVTMLSLSHYCSFSITARHSILRSWCQGQHYPLSVYGNACSWNAHTRGCGRLCSERRIYGDKKLGVWPRC